MLPQSHLPHKLGLSLSGGGFRATIFHIGVLRRLAEMDLLRRVSAISTVSGGSVTGAHYLLHLKLELEKGRPLTRDDYIRIVANVEAEFRRGVARNPRSRLFLNFLRNLKIFCLAEPPGERMASLYQALVFRDVTRALGSNKPVRLMHTRVNVNIKDLAQYNRKQIEDATTPVQLVPKLILNASCLNSGREFLFTAAEVGDPQLGFIRMDEAQVVTDCKQLLAEVSKHKVDGAMKRFEALPARDDEKTARAVIRKQKAAIRWFLATEDARLAGASGVASKASGEGHHEPFMVELARPDLAAKLFDAEFRLLRNAKVAAWYLLDMEPWETLEVRGGYSRSEHWDRFCDAIAHIDKALAVAIGAEKERPIDETLLEFIACIYYLRSARAFAWDVARGLERLRLVDAVAASANFPPVFTPYHIRDLYDAERIKVVSLTDGGVHDNLGIRSLMDDGCTDLIVSDAGGLYQESSSPAGDRIRMMARIGNVLTAHVRNLQLDKLHDVAGASTAVATARASGVKFEKDPGFDLSSTAFFHMLSNPSDADRPGALPQHPYAREIAHVRTDLDVFGTVEIDALIYQGYQLADRFVHKYLSRDLWDADRVPPPRMPTPAGPRVGEILSVASQRIFRGCALYPVVKWTLILAAVALIMLAMIRERLSLPGMLHEAVLLPVTAVATVVPWLVDAADAVGGWTWSYVRRAFTLGAPESVAALAAVALVAFLLFSDWIDRACRKLALRWLPKDVRAQSKRLRVARVLGPWRRNLAWLFWLAPLWIALFGTVCCLLLMLGGVLARTAASRVPADESAPIAGSDPAPGKANS